MLILAPAFGLSSYADLFTNRQLVALTTFSELVTEARTKIADDARAPLLALLYPGVDPREQFHEDHIFPRSILRSKAKMRAA